MASMVNEETEYQVTEEEEIEREEHNEEDSHVAEGEEIENVEASDGNDESKEVDSEPGNDKNESDEEEFAGFDEDEIKVTSKKRQIESDEEDVNGDDENSVRENSREEVNSGEEDNEDEEVQDESVQNGEEDEEDKDNASGENVATDEVAQEQEESEEETFQRPIKKKNGDQPSDLEMMLARNKAQKAKNRRRNKVDSEEINDWDNKISLIVTEMKNVAAEDRVSNEKGMLSLQKYKMMNTVVNMLQKTEYHASMIELGVLGAIAEWLAPLPDRSLPNIKIREFMINTLREFGEINTDYLKSSGIGKAVMFLYKHSKETKENKKKLERLISDWSRPIFSLDGNFKQLSKEERLERDLEHVKMMSSREKQKNGRTIDDLLDATDTRKSKKKRDEGSDTAEEPKKFLRPGEVGFCPRARVPIPSSKDYVIRPKSNIEVETEGSRKSGKKTETRLDKHKKRFEELKKKSKSSRAITMVAAGGK